MQNLHWSDVSKQEENLHDLKNLLTTKSHDFMCLLDHGKQREVIYSEKGGVWLRRGKKSTEISWEPYDHMHWQK